jgi:serine/threonine-protein kinase
VLAGRYRIIGLLGRGGMGEVYHARDEKLDQEVALKFLPEAAASPAVLDRFHAEVRIARQISHPNVCRVYDMGEIEGTPFISMEYVDGEDLRSLLRRIGRLPGDKALETARRLCAGLAAAHGTGVLHRDLKPANIMIDGEGRVHLMDFGLAAVATEIEGADVRSGTPAYMAPEQAAGRSVSARSDIYALGMVLFEMFTGRRAFDESSDRSEVPSASGIVGDVDPAVETVIRRCLNPDPSRRPDSALDVARALPGGDPLAEALAAGDTPSPDMVAASDDTGTLSIRTAIACLVVVGVGLIAVFPIRQQTQLLAKIPAPHGPAFLTERAREIAAAVGYPGPSADTAFGFNSRRPTLGWLDDNLEPDEIRRALRGGRPPMMEFWYRQSPRPLIPLNARSEVSVNDPPGIISDMVTLVLDLDGRLTVFLATPPQEDPPSQSEPVDWQPLFDAAGLDMSRWTPAEPRLVSFRGFDERLAWMGSFPEAPSVPMRIEAAGWKGRPVWFVTGGPWTIPVRQVVAEEQLFRRAGRTAITALVTLVGIAAVLLAWRNHRHGRGDLRGALRLSGFVLIAWLVQWLLLAHHLPLGPEFGKLSWALSEALFYGAVLLVLYMALEPYVRKRWPQSLISWTRLLDGDWRDPVVGGHVLLGVAAGVVLGLLFELPLALDALRNGLGLDVTSVLALRGPVEAAVLPLRNLVGSGLPLALAGFFMYFLLRVLLRREWAAVVVFVGVFATPAVLSGQLPAIVVNVVGPLAQVWVLRRFGLLPFVALFVAQNTVRQLPMTLDFSAWYAHATITALVIVVGLAAGSFYVALGGRKVLREDFLDA